MSRWSIRFALLCLTWLSACGGGGGGSETGGVPEPTSIEGRLLRLSSVGRAVPAPSGAGVRLYALDQSGSPTGIPVSSTITDSQGRFRLDLPDGTSMSQDLLVEGDDGAGGHWRALAVTRTVELGPGSETIVRELLAIRNERRSPFAVETRRLGLLQYNAALALGLVENRSSEPRGAVRDLRRWLLIDPAVSSALASLRSSGRLPTTLGDIGGLFGATPTAMDTLDANGVRRLFAVTPWELDPSKLIVSERTEGDTTSSGHERWELAGDGIHLVTASSNDAVTLALLDAIGSHSRASFDLTEGRVQRLATVHASTERVDFDGDHVVDELTYTLDQTVIGTETVEVFDDGRPALRVDFRIRLVIDLSRGGSLSSTESVSQWLLPFAGPVLQTTRVAVTDKDGRTTEQTMTRRAIRSAQLDVSWPGPVRLRAAPLAATAGESLPHAFAAGPDTLLLLANSAPGATWGGDLGLFVRDADSGEAVADLVHANTGSSLRYFVSPDGRKFYVCQDKALPPEWSTVVHTTTPAEAAALGATIVRYDAETLTEEARIALPPRPSQLVPGMAFPRNRVHSMLISPTDPNEFVAGSEGGAVLVRDTTFAAQTLVHPTGGEVLLTDGRARLVGMVALRGWDASRNEIHFEIDGGGPYGRIVPVAPDGLDVADARQGLPLLASLAGTYPSEAVFDRMTTNRAYLSRYRVAIDTATGAVIADLASSDDIALSVARCTWHAEQVVCVNGSEIVELSPSDLSVMRRLSLHVDLRRIAGGIVPSGVLNDFVGFVGEGRLVYIGHDILDRGELSNPLVVFELAYGR